MLNFKIDISNSIQTEDVTKEQLIQPFLPNLSINNNCVQIQNGIQQNDQLYQSYIHQFKSLLLQGAGICKLQLNDKDFSFFFATYKDNLWLDIFSIFDGNVKSGIQGEMTMQLARILIDLSTDFAITSSNNFNRQSQLWILKDFQIGCHTISIIPPEQQLMNLIKGYTPCGQDWNNAKDEGFMQIHGKIQPVGYQKKIIIDLPNGEHKYIQYNDFVTIQIGCMNSQKWIIKLKQGKECFNMMYSVTTKFLDAKYRYLQSNIHLWLRVL